MTYKQALDALGSSINTTLYNNLSLGNKSRLYLVANNYVFNIVNTTTSNLDFEESNMGNYFTARYWHVGFNNDSYTKLGTASSGGTMTITDNSNDTMTSTFVGTWTIYLD